MERNLDFLQALSLFADFDGWDIQRKNELASRLYAFADFLVDNFFLPCRTTYNPVFNSIEGSEFGIP